MNSLLNTNLANVRQVMSGESPLSRWISETKTRSGLPGQGGEKYGTRGRHGQGGGQYGASGRHDQGGNDGDTYYTRWTSKRITPVVSIAHTACPISPSHLNLHKLLVMFYVSQLPHR